MALCKLPTSFLCYGATDWSPEKKHLRGHPDIELYSQTDLWKGQRIVGMGVRQQENFSKGSASLPITSVL